MDVTYLIGAFVRAVDFEVAILVDVPAFPSAHYHTGG